MTAVPSCEIYGYSIDRLKELLSTKSEASPRTIEGKLQTRYFQDYFQKIGAQTIVVENNYIDRDFLEDFAGYYVRCFYKYRRVCTRLHFFSLDFTEGDFNAMLEGEKGKLTAGLLNDKYLGFIVVKPLPETMIGRTCLVSYPEEGRRFYPVRRPYTANLVGIPLTVETLAFQEQDTVAAACATSALWSAFQGTGMLFHHPILSPVEITRTATQHWVSQTRAMPNHGLLLPQMVHAMKQVGLEPLMIGATDLGILRSTLYGYLRGGVPVLLLVNLYDAGDKSNHYHAIAATGFSLGGALAPAGGTFKLKADRIDKLYAHDDGVGPFSRLSFAGKSHLSSSWKLSGPVEVHPLYMLIPLYHKIRIPFEAIFNIVRCFDAFLRTLALAPHHALPIDLEWDVCLSSVNAFRTDILAATELSGPVRRDIVQQPLPRFLWRATGRQGNDRAIELVFDATDIEGGHVFLRAVEYDGKLCGVLRGLAKTMTIGGLFSTHPDWASLEPIIAGFQK